MTMQEMDHNIVSMRGLSSVVLLSLVVFQLAVAVLLDVGPLGGAGQEGIANEYHSFHECKYNEVNVHLSCKV